MKKVTMIGFCTMYFNELPYHKTVDQAFEKVNNIVKELTGAKMFKSYSDFKTVMRGISN